MSATTHEEHRIRNAWVDGVTVFAGTALILVGLFQALEGLSALAGDKTFHATDYAFEMNLTTWGWVHLIVGLISVAIGAAALAGMELAYVLGIMIAALGTMTSFVFIPWYPVWSIVVIAFNITVIWAFCGQMSKRRVIDM